VRITITETNVQNFIFFMIRNFELFPFFTTNMDKIKIDIARAITPPNFEGMDRRITYANRKYHSGWMCTGATNGFAGLKFSTSPRIFGMFDTIYIIKIIIMMAGRLSFAENVG
jgi:hypothetical protein